jgi:hypothetical protein
LRCRPGATKLIKTVTDVGAVYVQAHCGGNDVAVTLDAQGNRMRVTWGKAKAEELQRCP